MTHSTSTPSDLGSNTWSSPFDDLLAPGFPSLIDPPGEAAIQPAATQMGTPGQDILCWDGAQSYDDTCAIRCQEFILEQFTGMEVDEHALVQQAMDAGVYAPGCGTLPNDVGTLLELNGIPVTRYEGASVFNLAHELAQGHKVIVGLDSGEMWNQHPILESLSDQLGMSGADHAVVVSGIDTSDPNDVRVIISDPGTGEAAASYPMDQFLDAWRDGNCFMVATQEPAPPTLPEMAYFDYTAGHIPTVWGMPYDSFLGLADQPDSWGAALDSALNIGLNTMGLGWVNSFGLLDRDDTADDRQADAAEPSGFDPNTDLNPDPADRMDQDPDDQRLI